MSETNSIPAEETQTRGSANPPILTWVMSVLCVILTLAHYTSANLPPTSPWHRIGHFGHLPATAIWSGQWPALFTTLFIHGQAGHPILTAMHLGFNLMVLIQAGRVLEATLHPLAYYLFFVAAAMVGSGAELALTGSTGVGASGVVYAMFGLLWAGRKRDEEWAEVANPLAIWLVVGWAVICVILTQFKVIAIANGAHFAGLFFGLAVGWVFIAKRHRFWGALILSGLAAVVILSLTWLPWSPYWNFWKGVKAREARRYDEAVDWFERSARLGMPEWQVAGNIAWTRILQENPDAVLVPRTAPDQPDLQRFGPRADENQAPPLLNVPPNQGNR